MTVFPPLYCEFGKNLILGKSVFINMGCTFQDTGGITIGDETLIGHGSIVTTLNHAVDPDRRADMLPAPVVIGRKVWPRRRPHDRISGLAQLIEGLLTNSATRPRGDSGKGSQPGGIGSGGAYDRSVFLENLVFDALDPRRLGRFWRAALDAAMLTDEPDGFEIRLHHQSGPDLDLCFQRVPEPPSEPLRLHLDLRGGEHQQATVDRLLDLGARPLDIGQHDVPWVVLGDVEGNPFCVMEEREAYFETGPIAALPPDSGDPRRDGELWGWLTGWTPVPGVAPLTLRHPSRLGPLLELCPEAEPKGPGKNRLHLDVRLESGEDPEQVARGIMERGGQEVEHGWGTPPWRVYADGSGNEFCVLPDRS